jgi:hypothetical protein
MPIMDCFLLDNSPCKLYSHRLFLALLVLFLSLYKCFDGLTLIGGVSSMDLHYR